MKTINMNMRKTSDNSCNLTFESDVEGLATTYANLYRRALLQSSPRMAVAGIKCKVNNKYVSNLFEIVPGLTGCLIDISQKLHNAVFNIQTDCDAFIIDINLSGKVMLSDVADMSNITVSYGDVDELRLITPDETLANIVGGNELTLSVFFVNGSGFSHKDINTQSLIALIGEDEAKKWIVTDSQHRGVLKVSYHENTTLGRQTIILGVESYEDKIEEIVNNCTEALIDQITKFRQ